MYSVPAGEAGCSEGLSCLCSAIAFTDHMLFDSLPEIMSDRVFSWRTSNRNCTFHAES
jgi:hypothetical protein